ncbi:MAG: GntR family transcriptional regulator [Burkholderiales bacterium]|nr:GntR family transcriptional regulator [Burkholderiales bacterium]
MAIESKLDRPKSLTDLAVDEIRGAIVNGRLAFGEQLSEAVLAVKLGISKTPVREALLRLKLERLVDVQPQRGTFVFTLSPGEVHEICAFRAMAECAALDLAMSLDRPALLAALERVLAGMDRVGPAADRELVKRVDAAFHKAIVDACGNQYLQSAYGLIACKIHALRARLPHHDEKVDGCIGTHHTIVDHIRGARKREAVAALRAHIRSTEEAYLAAASVAPPAARRSG